MPDQFKTLFSTTLGAPELEADNEHVLFTNNSNTTRVIRNINIQNDNGVFLEKGKGTYLTIDGHFVSSIDEQGLSGELVVPPYATLRIHNHSYPVTYTRTKEFWQEGGSGRIYVKGYIADQNSGEELYTIYEKRGYSTSPTYGYNVIDVAGAYGFETNKYIFYIFHDNNSQQFICRDGIDGVNTFGSSTIYTENYKSYGFGDDNEEGTGDWGVQAWSPFNSWYYIGLLRDPFNWTARPEKSGRQSLNTLSPMPTSSYPRGHNNSTAHFWIPSSSYSQHVYMFGDKYRQGVFFDLSGQGWANSGNYDFVSSIDYENDTLYIYRPQNTTSMGVAKCNIPWSEINSYASPSMVTVSDFTKSIVSLPATIGTQSFGACQLSNDNTGGFGFKTDNGMHYMCYPDGSTKFVRNNPTFNGQTVSVGGNGAVWRMKGTHPSSTYISNTAGLSSPTFTVSAVGIEIT